MMGQNEVNIPITATDKTSRAFASARNNIKALSVDGAKLTRMITGAFGATVGISTFVRLTKESINYGSSLTDAAEATNTAIEELQVLNYAAKEVGASQQQLSNALVRVQKSTYDAQKGLSTAVDAFAVLNINVDKFAQLTPERKLETIGRAMASANDKGKAFGAALDIIGSRNAPKLNEVLLRLANEGFDGVSAAARDAGQIMTTEVAVSMEEMADAMAEVGTRLKVIWSDVVVQVAANIPALRTVTVELAAAQKNVERFQKDVENFDNKKGMAGFGRMLGTNRHELVSRLKEAEAMVSMLTKKRDELLNTDKADTSGLIPEAAVERTKSDVSDMISHINKLNKAKGALSPEDLAFKQMNDALKDKTSDPIDEWTQKNLTAHQMIVHSMQNASDSMTDSFVDFLDTGTFSFKGFVGSILKDMARLTFQQSVSNPLMSALSGGLSGVFGGARASGGPVSSGKTYLVGEKGPELFSPNSSGSITPNHAIASAAAPVNISFNVSSFDSASFDQGIAQRRKLIVGMVDEALNRRGRRGVSQ